MAKLIKLFCVTGLGILLLLCLASCEQKQEPVKAQKQVMVVSKSIELPKKLEKKTPHGQRNDPKATSATKKERPLDEISASAPVNMTQKALPVKVASDSGGEVDEIQTSVLAEMVSADQVLKAKTYDTKGRVDPFIPLLSEKEEMTVAEPVDDKPKRLLTPLEKMELSQIKLVAIVAVKGRYIAMVEEASGKGYEVSVGTYMGKNGGQVSAINDNGVVVKEYVKDFKGNRQERLQEIKFHKSEGGE